MNLKKNVFSTNPLNDDFEQYIENEFIDNKTNDDIKTDNTNIITANNNKNVIVKPEFIIVSKNDDRYKNIPIEKLSHIYLSYNNKTTGCFYIPLNSISNIILDKNISKNYTFCEYRNDKHTPFYKLFFDFDLKISKNPSFSIYSDGFNDYIDYFIGNQLNN